MKFRTAMLVLLLPVGALFADPMVESVQQALKDEGFYYGDITGNKDSDTTAAIRRYQIRNGLQITGDLNDETLKALGVNSSGGRAVVKASPTIPPDTAESKAPLKSEPEPEQDQEPTNPMIGQRFPRAPQQNPQPDEGGVVPVSPGENFARTPYESAPPQVQRKVIASAQNVLTQRGLYHGATEGEMTPDFEFSLRAYQARVKLPVTGRLDLETLAALELLPGGNRPVYLPRRRPGERPVRGEWIRDR
ncbi:MAG TPA: peptidoglycan-binding domain-containing protein [Chthoniobacterales bacterium]|nr:peptidoglycan-binding domain-containing protein [Chthoniobacterales bacterium]